MDLFRREARFQREIFFESRSDPAALSGFWFSRKKHVGNACQSINTYNIYPLYIAAGEAYAGEPRGTRLLCSKHGDLVEKFFFLFSGKTCFGEKLKDGYSSSVLPERLQQATPAFSVGTTHTGVSVDDARNFAPIVDVRIETSTAKLCTDCVGGGSRNILDGKLCIGTPLRIEDCFFKRDFFRTKKRPNGHDTFKQLTCFFFFLRESCVIEVRHILTTLEKGAIVSCSIILWHRMAFCLQTANFLGGTSSRCLMSRLLVEYLLTYSHYLSRGDYGLYHKLGHRRTKFQVPHSTMPREPDTVVYCRRGKTLLRYRLPRK